MQYVPIQIQSLQGDADIAFDLYLKINNKYLLFIRQGDGLESERLDKLKRFEGTRLYIEKTSINQLKTYVGDLLEVTLGVNLEEDKTQTINIGHQNSDRQFFESPAKKKSSQNQKTNTDVKLSPQMRAMLARIKEETPQQTMKRQADILTSVAQTAIDVLNKIIADPDSVVAYQIASKAAKGIVLALEQSPDMIHELFTKHDLESSPLICHSKNVACLCVALGIKQGLKRDELYQLATAALVHDIGLLKIENGEKIFTQRKSDLDEPTQKQYLTHSDLGHHLSEDKNFIPENVKKLIKYHEENLSGLGPHKLMQLDMPTQILSLVNRFDKTLIEQQCSIKEAFQHLTLNEIGNFDLKLLEALKKTLQNDKLQINETWSL
jgi:HD-GYP domain-containing protein (c-di-GMP phosphodiesterase class II)